MFRRVNVFFRKAYRVIWGSIYAFSENNDSLKASALTFYTLISIVPFLAVALGIASGFGFDEYLERQLKASFEQQQQAITLALKFAHSLLQNVKGSLIAGIGLIALLWSNISMLNNIENALNSIWRVRTPRTWAKKFTDYLAAMIICPIFLVVSSSLSVYLMTQITRTASDYPLLEYITPILKFLFQLLPFIISILLFIVIYLFIPNVSIRARPRIWAGIFAGITFQLWQWIYIRFQVELSNYNVVYGTFAALPLFLIWLQVSWLIVLAGAELAAHIENEISNIYTNNKEKLVSINQKELGLLILSICVRDFYEGKTPPTIVEIARELSLQILPVQQMCETLEESHILAKVYLNNSHARFLPSKDPALFSLKNVSDSIESHQHNPVLVENSETLEKITKALNGFDKTVEEMPANVTLNKIIKE